MQSKDVRNLIIGLIVLIIGMFLLMHISTGIIGNYQTNAIGPFKGLMYSVESFSSMIIMGGIVIILLLLPLYIYAKKREKRLEELELQKQRDYALQREEQLKRERMLEQQLYKQQLRQRVYQQQPRYKYAQQRRYI